MVVNSIPSTSRPSYYEESEKNPVSGRIIGAGRTTEKISEQDVVVVAMADQRDKIGQDERESAFLPETSTPLQKRFESPKSARQIRRIESAAPSTRQERISETSENFEDVDLSTPTSVSKQRIRPKASQLTSKQDKRMKISKQEKRKKSC